MSVQLVIPGMPVFVNPERMQLLENLSALRQEWESAAEGGSLLDVTASVGLMLFDIAARLGLTPDESSFVFGAQLNNEITAVLENEPAQ